VKAVYNVNHGRIVVYNVNHGRIVVYNVNHGRIVVYNVNHGRIVIIHRSINVSSVLLTHLSSAVIVGGNSKFI